MKKIPLNQLSAYFPYKVKAIFNETEKSRKKVIGTICVIYDNSSIVCYDTVNSSPNNYKLVLYPPEGVEKLAVDFWKDMPMTDFNKQRFLSAKTDIFGLIEKGLAISVDTLPTDPYKKKKK